MASTTSFPSDPQLLNLICMFNKYFKLNMFNLIYHLLFSYPNTCLETHPSSIPSSFACILLSCIHLC
jgi:hypothetical protein